MPHPAWYCSSLTFSIRQAVPEWRCASWPWLPWRRASASHPAGTKSRRPAECARSGAPALCQAAASRHDQRLAQRARRLLALKADPKLQARVDDLAARHSRGVLSPEEQAEYGCYVSYSTFVAILRSKARQL